MEQAVEPTRQELEVQATAWYPPFPLQLDRSTTFTWVAHPLPPPAGWVGTMVEALPTKERTERLAVAPLTFEGPHMAWQTGSWSPAAEAAEAVPVHQ
jgi:hypothetical protein